MIPKDPYYAGLLGGVAFSVIVAVGGGVLTKLSPWYYTLKQPGWKPPDWAFGPIWTTILTLVAFAIAYAWAAADAGQRTLIIVALIANGILNIAWSGLFFTMQKPTWAMVELVVFWFSIIGIIYALGATSRTAGFLLVPYLVWVTIAGVLNFSIIRLNPA